MPWFNDDVEITPHEIHMQEIDSFINEMFGFFSYFDVRELVVSAMENTLKSEYPEVPYSAREILQWAQWNDEESFLMTPGGQAIQGQGWTQDIFGAPSIDPLTEKPNSQEKIDGAIVTAAKSATSNIVKVTIALAAVGLLYAFAKSKAIKLGGT